MSGGGGGGGGGKSRFGAFDRDDGRDRGRGLVMEIEGECDGEW